VTCPRSRRCGRLRERCLRAVSATSKSHLGGPLPGDRGKTGKPWLSRPESSTATRTLFDEDRPAGRVVPAAGTTSTRGARGEEIVASIRDGRDPRHWRDRLRARITDRPSPTSASRDALSRSRARCRPHAALRTMGSSPPVEPSGLARPHGRRRPRMTSRRGSERRRQRPGGQSAGWSRP